MILPLRQIAINSQSPPFSCHFFLELFDVVFVDTLGINHVPVQLIKFLWKIILAFVVSPIAILEESVFNFSHRLFLIIYVEPISILMEGKEVRLVTPAA